MVRDVGALDKTQPSQFGQLCKLKQCRVRDFGATGQVEVPDPRAMVSKDLDQSVRDLGAVTQMQVVKVFANGFDGACTSIRNLVAFGQGEISQSGCCGEDPE